MLCPFMKGFGNEPSACPVVDRSTKRPPRVNRATKPKTSTPQNHSYCNMAPPVDRSSKRKVFPKTEPSYVNLDGPRTRTQTLPLVKTLPGNSSGGGFFNPMKECPIDCEDELDYTLMKAPTRSEMTRCYSSCKENCRRASDNRECYEEMTVLPTTRQSGDRRSSSSLSSLADNEELYTPMNAVSMIKLCITFSMTTCELQLLVQSMRRDVILFLKILRFFCKSLNFPSFATLLFLALDGTETQKTIVVCRSRDC